MIGSMYCIFCDVCAAHWCNHGRKLRPRERRAAARKDGWGMRHVDGIWCDLCPRCLARHSEEAP